MRDRKHATAQRALQQVDELVRDGRRLDAIQILTAANHDQRDAEIERRLVSLRNEAFYDLDTTSALGSWPPPAPERFAGASSLPEVSAAGLTTDQVRSGIVGHGALIVRGLIPPARVRALIDDIDNAFTAYDAYVEGDPSDDAAWFEPFAPSSGGGLGPIRPWVRGGGGVLTVDSPRAMFDVLATFTEVGLADALAGYLGERPALGAKKWTLRRVPLTSGSNWHQDGAFLGDGIRAINVWVALSRCGDDSPGLDVVARRLDHIVETGTEGAIFDWSVGEPVVERVAEGAIVRPIFEAGDAMLFDDLFLHRTAISPEMTRERYAIESWFFAPSHYPLDQVPVTF